MKKLAQQKALYIDNLKKLQGEELKQKLIELLANGTFNSDDFYHDLKNKINISNEILIKIGKMFYEGEQPFNQDKDAAFKILNLASQRNSASGSYYLGVYYKDRINPAIEQLNKEYTKQNYATVAMQIKSALDNFIIAKDRGIQDLEAIFTELAIVAFNNGYYQEANRTLLYAENKADIQYYRALLNYELDKTSDVIEVVSQALNAPSKQEFYNFLFKNPVLNGPYNKVLSLISKEFEKLNKTNAETLVDQEILNNIKDIYQQLAVLAITAKDEVAIEILLEYGLVLEHLNLVQEQSEYLNSLLIVKNHKCIQPVEYTTLNNEELFNLPIEQLKENKANVLADRNILAINDLRYLIHLNRMIAIKEFPVITTSSPPFKYPNNKLIPSNKVSCIKYWICFGGTLFALPDGKNLVGIINKLITTLLYESKRHRFASQSCNSVKKIISLLDQRYDNYSEQQFQKLISKRESYSHDFFGEYPSDDSDNEMDNQLTEEESRQLTTKVQGLGIANIKNGIKELNYHIAKNYHTERNDSLLSQTKDKERTVIKHQTYFANIYQQAQKDLTVLNRHLKNKKPIHQAIKKVKTKFFVAQYRGVTYLTSKWNKPSRQTHRKFDEKEMPGFSASVYQTAQLDIFRNFDPNKYKTSEQQMLLRIVAEKLQAMLLSMRHTGEFRSDNYEFDNFAEYVQDLYSKDYDKFHTELSNGCLTKHIGRFFLNDRNPFVSTGDIPRHALRYAYGTKPYEGKEDERLRPRWNKEGQAERPYSGKVYISLHELTDYDENGPMHLVSLVDQAKCTVNNIVLAERETTFPAYLKEGRTVATHIAKYPSFSKEEYNPRYLKKYGIDEDLYNLLKKAFDKYPPHSYENRYLKKILGNWLCAYQENRLIEIACEEAKKKEGILIYKDKEGLFSFSLPDYGVFQGRDNKSEIAISRDYRKQAR